MGHVRYVRVDSYYRNALELMRSPRAKKAFDIAQEPEPLREKYGRTGLGQGCLLARRLVEAGVRFVTVSSWDHHTSVFTNLANEFLPELDRAFATLLEDLTARGMLETTIVLVTGEFGRTPEINVYAGRDHWPNCFSLAIAGGGIQGGRVWGASDKDGMFVKDNPVEVQNFVATIYHKLGSIVRKSTSATSAVPSNWRVMVSPCSSCDMELSSRNSCNRCQASTIRLLSTIW